MAVHADSACHGAQHRRADSAYARATVFGGIHHLHKLVVDNHLLAVHTVFGKVFHIDFLVVSPSAVKRQETALHALDLKTLQQLAAEMKASGGSHHGAFVFGKYTLIVIGILWHRAARDIFGKRRLPHRIEGLLELVVRAVVEETQRAAPGSGVVDHLRHHRVVLSKIELVAYAYLAGRLHEHVPEFVFLI